MVLEVSQVEAFLHLHHIGGSLIADCVMVYLVVRAISRFVGQANASIVHSEVTLLQLQINGVVISMLT